ncbi:MAG TPA: ABC transporter substrate-binding protein [Candidatus Acidoferrum sp.]|nr:ABC transporter substrate-binding protein [Candidatus Acidoferrum sp.]
MAMWVVAFALGAMAPATGWAGEPTDQLQLQLERVLKVVQDPEMKKEGRAAERRAVRKIAEEIFDFGDTARRALARHWAQRSPAEREEFVAVFTDVFEHAYLSKVELLQGDRVAYLGDSVEGGVATVRTRLTTKQGSQLGVDYRMQQRGASGRWLVYDVLIESVSLVDNYRNQFNSVIQRSSYQELVRRLKAMQGQLS